MALLIESMEMPRKCIRCPVNLYGRCLVNDDKDVGKATADAVRDKDCPLVPAADVRPVVRGRWIKHNATHVQKGGMYLECSCCHEYITVLGHVFDYCPNCGADMREPPKEG